MTRPIERLTDDRFEALADAYGGEIARWPEETRDAAALTVAEAPDFAAAVLAAASDLDVALDAWRPAEVSHDLREAILAGAPRARGGFSIGAWLTRAGLGAGLAAACAAGVVVGVQVSSLEQAPAGASAVATALNGYDAIAFDTAAVGVSG